MPQQFLHRPVPLQLLQAMSERTAHGYCDRRGIITLGAASMAEATTAAEAFTWNSASARAAATSRRNLAACTHRNYLFRVG